MIKNHLMFQFISEPSDVNFGGKVHGGIVMKWIDQTGYACASNWAEAYCVTAYVGGIRFCRPIGIGALVRVEAKIIYTHRTSMHIAIDVYARKITEKEFVKSTHCIIVFVAVDHEGKPIPVPEWVPETKEEQDLENYAKRLMDLRKGLDAEMAPYVCGL